MERSEPVLELRVPARPDSLREIRDRVRGWLEEHGCNPECAADVVMAIDEACQNVIRHAYRGDPEGEIELGIEKSGADLVVSIRDFAPPVDPERVRPRDLDDVRPGGIGTHLIREVMDRTEFVRPESGPGNVLRMVKRIA
jgi:sigma-B regulation protein RsbU (phosphoserine phosphatase)